VTSSMDAESTRPAKARKLRLDLKTVPASSRGEATEWALDLISRLRRSNYHIVR